MGPISTIRYKRITSKAEKLHSTHGLNAARVYLNNKMLSPISKALRWRLMDYEWVLAGFGEENKR